jgi:hypothetical protein
MPSALYLLAALLALSVSVFASFAQVTP